MEENLFFCEKLENDYSLKSKKEARLASFFFTFIPHLVNTSYIMSDNLSQEPYPEYKKDIILYKDFVAVEPYDNFCWTGCVMSVLNYFFGTSFWTKDTLDIISLVKGWMYNGSDVIDEMEIAIFFYKLWLKISMYWYSKNELQKYINDPKQYLANKNISYHENICFIDSVKAAQSILDSNDINLVDITSKSMYQVISENQKKNTVFMVWWDYYALRSEEYRRIEEYAWHLSICTGVRNDNFIMHDPGPYAKQWFLLSQTDMHKAITMYGEGVTFIWIEYPKWEDILNN